MVIKNLVISGGGPTGFISLGAIRETNRLGYWNLNSLESIFSSSIGSLIAFIIQLGYDWKTIEDYVIERPWDKAFSIIKTDLLDIYKNKGLDGEEILKIATGPLLRGKNLQEDITLMELYKITKIELNFVVTEANQNSYLTSEVLSYKTYPDMKINKALSASMAVPLLFKPINIEDKIYIDGGAMYNYPLSICLNNKKCKEDEILAFRNIWKSRTVDLKNSSSLEFAAALITKCHSTLEFIIKQPDIKNEIISEINLTNCDLIVWWEMLSTKEKRKELFDQGVKDAQNKINLSIDLKIDLKCQDQV
tara:strand:+ start:15403 stop:16320 length:918 start_codon:yes stop_codon:yes gene_type:complete